MWARPFNRSRLELEGTEFGIADGGGFDEMLVRGLLSAAGGVLAYLPEGAISREREIAWFDRSGELIRSVGKSDTFGFTLDLSPDEQWALYWQNNLHRPVTGNQIRRLELSTGISTSVATGVSPAISRDGNQIFYTSADGLWAQPRRGGAPRLIVRAADDEVRVSTHRKFYCITSPSGSLVVYQDRSSEGGWDLWAVPLGGGEPQALLNEPFDEAQAKISSDGRWIAYVSNESGRREVYVRAFPSGEGKRRLSLDGGSLPRWRSDGSEVYYVDDTGMLMAASAERTAETLNFERAKALFPVSSMYSNTDNYDLAPEYTYDVSRDGQRFLALWRPPEMPFPPLRVITNWEAGIAPAFSMR